MISAEMFPHEVRGIIQGPVMAWANFIMFVAIKCYPSMDDFFGKLTSIWPTEYQFESEKYK